MGEQLNEATTKFENPNQVLPGTNPEPMERGSSEIVHSMRKGTGSYKLHSLTIDGTQENYAVDPGRRIQEEEEGSAARAAGTAAGQTLEGNKAHQASVGCPNINAGEVLGKKSWRSSDGVEEAKPGLGDQGEVLGKKGSRLLGVKEAKPLQEDQGEMKSGGEPLLNRPRKSQNSPVEETPEQDYLPKKKYVPDADVPEQDYMPKKKYVPGADVPEQNK